MRKSRFFLTLVVHLISGGMVVLGSNFRWLGGAAVVLLFFLTLGCGSSATDALKQTADLSKKPSAPKINGGAQPSLPGPTSPTSPTVDTSIPPEVADPIPVPKRPERFLTATATLGPAIIKEGEYEEYATVSPWSAWWLPIKDDYLFEGTSDKPAPLQKYDLLSERLHGKKTKAAEVEKRDFFRPDAANWEGRCNAWAIASILEPVPTVKPVAIGDISFSSGDLKSLLIKSYEDVKGLSIYGESFVDGDPDAVMDDIYPDQFHRILQTEIFGKRRPFIMDKDPGAAVWNAPVWGVQMKITRDPADRHLMHVDAWVYFTDPIIRPADYDSPKPREVNHEYTYDLYGYPLADGTFKVAYGVWTGLAREDHPDMVMALPEKLESITHTSRNSEIDNALVYEIIQKSTSPAN